MWGGPPDDNMLGLSEVVLRLRYDLNQNQDSETDPTPFCSLEHCDRGITKVCKGARI